MNSFIYTPQTFPTETAAFNLNAADIDATFAPNVIRSRMVDGVNLPYKNYGKYTVLYNPSKITEAEIRAWLAENEESVSNLPLPVDERLEKAKKKFGKLKLGGDIDSSKVRRQYNYVVAYLRDVHGVDELSILDTVDDDGKILASFFELATPYFA